MESWSYSAYSTAAQCPQKYKYLFIDKLKAETESGDMTFGSALHSALNADLTGQDGSAVFELFWSSYKDKPLEYGRYKWADLAKLGTKFLQTFRTKYAPRIKLEFAETRLYGEYRGTKLEGTPDCLATFDGTRTLIDFKTSGQNYSADKGTIALQLYLYAYLLIQNGHGPIDKLAYFVFNKGTGCIQTPLILDFSEERMKQFLNQMTDHIELLSESTHCKNVGACLDYGKRCPFWTRCHG